MQLSYHAKLMHELLLDIGRNGGSAESGSIKEHIRTFMLEGFVVTTYKETENGITQYSALAETKGNSEYVTYCSFPSPTVEDAEKQIYKYVRGYREAKNKRK